MTALHEVKDIFALACDSDLLVKLDISFVSKLIVKGFLFLGNDIKLLHSKGSIFLMNVKVKYRVLGAYRVCHKNIHSPFWLLRTNQSIKCTKLLDRLKTSNKWAIEDIFIWFRFDGRDQIFCFCNEKVQVDLDRFYCFIVALRSLL